MARITRLKKIAQLKTSQKLERQILGKLNVEGKFATDFIRNNLFNEASAEFSTATIKRREKLLRQVRDGTFNPNRYLSRGDFGVEFSGLTIQERIDLASEILDPYTKYQSEITEIWDSYNAGELGKVGVKNGKAIRTARDLIDRTLNGEDVGGILAKKRKK